MRPLNRNHRHLKMNHLKGNSLRGQTLIIALLVLGVLLILGAVFSSIISRTIKSSSTGVGRGLTSDYAESGIRYAHSQLVNSELGADWRGSSTQMVPTAPNFTRDPDVYYLRPAGFAGTSSLNFPGSTRKDLGGPDGMGPFFRIDYRQGRALVRVRYAPGDSSIFSSGNAGNLRQAGLAKNYLVIESVGRRGEVKPNDPSTTGTRGAVQIQNYTDQNILDAEYAKMREFDEKEVTSRKLIAFAQIGLIDYGRFIANKYQSSQPIELGFPTNTGARYRDANTTNGLGIAPPVEFGGLMNTYNFGASGPDIFTESIQPFGGSLRVNGNLKVVGNLVANLNQSFGEGIQVSGDVSADAGSQLLLQSSKWDRPTSTWIQTTNTIAGNALNSNNPNFNTFDGIYRDGSAGLDTSNNSRGVGYIAPPTISANADSTENANTSRYVSLTRDSGRALATGNTGLFGHGEGVYVNNRNDFQISEDEEGRRLAGGAASMVQDWLNPFNDGAGVEFRSGWQGPFYIPVGSSLQLTTDGFSILRNSFAGQKPEERIWKQVDGRDTTLSVNRFRIGYGTDGKIHIVNTLTPGVANINGVIPPIQFNNGPVFNGVVYFEGNVRVRGEIPTDVQLTVVSNKTIYIEGSITKGLRPNDVTAAYPSVISAAGRLNRPSRSALMLMAKDYVTLNPTMFLGPSTATNMQSSKAGQGNGGYNPATISGTNGSVSLQMQLPLDQTDPVVANWAPYSALYREYDPTAPTNPLGTGAAERTNLLLTHALEFSSAGPSNAFFGIDVNRGVNPDRAGANSGREYQFETLNSVTNTAKLVWASLSPVPNIPAFEGIYGLGTEAWQQAPKFETVSIPIVSPTDTVLSLVTNRMRESFNTNNYDLIVEGTNLLELSTTQLGKQASGNYLLARAAAIPMDVKIEASIFAEEGSFFVIPGEWFNPNPNDRRDQLEARVLALGGNLQAREQASRERLESFGSTPQTPFYGEPIDVRISILGSVAENLPPVMSQQSEWLKKWGWIPVKQAGVFNGATGVPRNIPYSHISSFTKASDAQIPFNPSPFTSNLTITYDPVLATGRAKGFGFDTPALAADPTSANPMIRTSTMNGVTYALAPMPRLPVSPTLAYFGEIK
jgi:hypothetical protein